MKRKEYEEVSRSATEIVIRFLTYGEVRMVEGSMVVTAGEQVTFEHSEHWEFYTNPEELTRG